MAYGAQGEGEEPQTLCGDSITGYLAVHCPPRKHRSSPPNSPGHCLLFVKVSVASKDKELLLNLMLCVNLRDSSLSRPLVL